MQPVFFWPSATHSLIKQSATDGDCFETRFDWIDIDQHKQYKWEVVFGVFIKIQNGHGPWVHFVFRHPLQMA
jgi:hypothetical protein